MEIVPNYDELWAISDIHMGGERSATRNFQIFNRGQRLGHFIRHLTTHRAEDEVALVLNGKPGTAMPPWTQLSDVDLAAVITYTRNGLGNKTGEALQPSEIKAARR